MKELFFLIKYVSNHLYIQVLFYFMQVKINQYFLTKVDLIPTLSAAWKAKVKLRL